MFIGLLGNVNYNSLSVLLLSLSYKPCKLQKEILLKIKIYLGVPFKLLPACPIDENRSSETNKTSPLHFTPQIKIFFAEKGNLKFSDSKVRWKEESEKFSPSQNFKLHLKFSGR